MKNKERRDDGRYTPEVTDDELLAAVRTHEPAATSEVAGEVDMTRQGVDRRLRQLRDDGRVNSKKIGASLVWFPVGDDTDDGDSPLDSRGESRDDATDVTLPDDIPECVAPPAARTAIQAAVRHVREHGPVERRDIVNAIMPDHPLKYDTAELPLGSGARSRGDVLWWRRVVLPGLKTNGVSKRDDGGWHVADGGGES